MVNTGNRQQVKTISMESTAYHEGLPGHHTCRFPFSRNYPRSRPSGSRVVTPSSSKDGDSTPSGGKEVGFYKDPYSDYGRLQDEMLRAIRLVVDTGLHYKKWTRDQVVQFFRDHSAIDEIEVQRETDRYIVWPGQALAYKIGQLKIIELREHARKELGNRFDIRQFHDEVLSAGALPLDVLEARINNWINATKANGKRG